MNICFIWQFCSQSINFARVLHKKYLLGPTRGLQKSKRSKNLSKTLAYSCRFWLTLADSGQLWLTFEDSGWLWLTMSDPGWLWLSLADSYWPWLTLAYSSWLLPTLTDSGLLWPNMADSFWLCLTRVIKSHPESVRVSQSQPKSARVSKSFGLFLTFWCPWGAPKDFSPTWPSGPSWSCSRDFRVLSSFICPLPMQFFCLVGLVQSVPCPWTGAISILSRALKTRMCSGVQSLSQSRVEPKKRECVLEFDLDLDLE